MESRAQHVNGLRTGTRPPLGGNSMPRLAGVTNRIGSCVNPAQFVLHYIKFSSPISFVGARTGVAEVVSWPGGGGSNLSSVYVGGEDPPPGGGAGTPDHRGTGSLQ